MKIRVLGWQYENIRRMDCLEVDLTREDETPYPNSLIMMPNGTGKTTTLYLIRAALSGEAIKWKAREVRSFRPPLSETEEGRFLLKMAFGEDIYYYILHLNYEEGTAWYETSSAMMAGGYETGHRVPYSLKGIIDSENFVMRFVFDGEQARKTLDSGSQEAENAIVYLYQLYKLDDLIKDIDRLVETRQQSSSGGATERSIKVFQGKYERRARIFQQLEHEEKELSRELAQITEKKRRNEQRYQEIIAQDHRMQSEQERLLQEKEENQRERNEIVAQLMSSVRKPYNLQMDLHTRMKSLADNMRVLKLPKTTAKEFFRELAKGRECICGRCIGEQERKNILEKADDYLGQDSLIVVNSIKGALNEYERDSSCQDLKERLQAAMEKENQIASSLNRLAVTMAAQGHQEILQIQKETEDLAEKEQKYEKRLERLTTADYIVNTGLNSENNIPLAKKAKEEAEKSFQKAAGTYRFTQQAKKMKRYIEEIRTSALEKLKQYMVCETNQKIQNLIANDFVNIRKIDGHLVLEGKEGISEGQTLAVAYAYIGTLFEHSDFEYPFIVDSPAAPMDLSVRREVAEILPRLFGQNVILVTSGEKRGFADVFLERDDVQYLTIQGEKNQPVECIPGKEYFVQYQEKKGEG